MSSNGRWLAFLAVVALAVFFRLYQIRSIPPGLFIDEAQNGLDASTLQRGKRFPVYIEGAGVKARSRGPLYHYIMAGVFSVFGTTVTSIRLTSALIGIATVIAFFFLCEHLWGTRRASLAAALLAVCRWHVTFSRIGLRAITVPLCIVLALLALSRVVRRGTLPAALMFGATLALGFYAYPAYWIVPVPLAVVFLVKVRRSASLPGSNRARLILAAAAAFLLTAAPLTRYAIQKPDYLFARAVETSVPITESDGRGISVRDNVWKVLLMLHFRGDPEARHNIPARPLLDPIMGIAFLLGLLVLLRTIRIGTPLKVGTLLCWLLLLLPSVVTGAAPHAMRSLAAVLAVCAICAEGVDAAGGLVARTMLRRLPVAFVLPVAVLGVITLWNYHDYFVVWGHNEAVAKGFTADIPRFFDYCAELAEHDDVYVSPYIYYSPNIRFLALAQQVSLKLIKDETAFIAHSAPARDRVFVAEQPGLSLLLRRMYPEMKTLGTYSVYAAHSGRVLHVRKEALRRTLGDEERASVRYFVGKMLAGFQAQSRRW